MPGGENGQSEPQDGTGAAQGGTDAEAQRVALERAALANQRVLEAVEANRAETAEALRQVRQEYTATQARLERLLMAVDVSGTEMAGNQRQFREMEARLVGVKDQAVVAKRLLAETEARAEISKKFRPIQSLRSSDSETDAELGRYRFAAAKLEEAALGATLATGILKDHPEIPGAAEAIKYLEKSTTSAESGVRGLLIGAMAVDKAPLYTHKFVSTQVAKVMVKEVPGYDTFGLVSPGLTELFSKRDEELEKEQQRKARFAKQQDKSGDQSAGGNSEVECWKCHKGGHIAKICQG